MTAADLVQVLAIQSVQLAVVIVAVGALATTLGRRRPHLAHALWLVVLVKCFTPPWLTSPTSAFGRWQQRSEQPTPVVAAAQHDARLELSHDAANGILVTDRAEPDTAAQPTALAAPAPAPWTTREWRIASWPSASRVIGAWVAGMIAVCGWLIVKLLRLRREMQAHVDLASPELETLVAKMAADLRLRRGVRILVSRRGLGPAAFDGLRPTIIIPAELTAASQPAARDAMLAHELVHLRRGDFWLGLAQLAAQAVWWFHPLVWWANRQMRRQRERACDAEVLAAGLSEPAEYARALVSMLDWQRRWQPQGLVPGIGQRDVTATRLALILRFDAAHRRCTSWWAVAAAAALAVVVLPGAAPPSAQRETQITQGEPQIAQGDTVRQNAAPPATAPATSGEQPIQAGVSGSITTATGSGLSVTAGPVGLTPEQGNSSDFGSPVWSTFSAYPSEHPEPSAQHQAAVEKLTALGAKVTRGFLQPLFRSGPRFGYHLLVDERLQVTDDWLPLLRQMDSLDAVLVHGNSISPEQLADWAAISTVESLTLFQVRDAHLAALPTDAGPKRLQLYLNESPDPVPSLARLQGVTDMMLESPHLETLAAVPSMANLRSLSLQLVEDFKDDFERLGQVRTLERLMVIGPQRSLAKLVPLGKLTKLKELSLIFSEAAKEEPAADFTWLEKLTALEAAQLAFGNGREDSEIGPEVTQALAKLPALRAASLRQVTDAGLAALCQSKTLWKLAVLGEKQSPSAAGLARLADLKTLEILKVYGCKVDDSALKAWGTLPNLLWLEVVAQHHEADSVHVTDAGLLGLRGLTKLAHL